MCEMAPAIIYLFDRMGVPFSRHPGRAASDFRRFGGTKHQSHWPLPELRRQLVR